MHVTKLTPRLLLAAWLLAVGWLASVPGILPAAFAAAAWLDGEHGVMLGADTEAATVVLTHGAQNAGQCHAQIHRHSAFARLLTSCAVSTTGGADHVVKFAATSCGAVARKLELAPSFGEGAITVRVPVVAAAVELVFLRPHAGAKDGLAVEMGARIPKLPALRPALLI